MTDPLLAPEVVGYCGLVVPRRATYYGIAISSELDDVARSTFAHTEKMLTDLASSPITVTKNIENISPIDQQVLGTCAAMMIEEASEKPENLAVLAAVIRQITTWDYFIIRGSLVADDARSGIARLAVTSPLEAREAFSKIAEVSLIDSLNQIAGMFNNKPH